MFDNQPNQLLRKELQTTVSELLQLSSNIPPQRKQLLRELTDFIVARKQANQPIKLNFICTHNSRRSHIAQLWAQAAAYYYKIENVQCFSGGTEATAFNPRAVQAMEDAGFQIDLVQSGDNPTYAVRFSDHAGPLLVFSKKYDDEINPASDFAAVMTCTHADENCPFVPGAVKRIGLTFDDPKDFDNTPQEKLKYAERVKEIGSEILYAFSQVQ